MVTTARIATPTRVECMKTRAMLTSARGRRTDRGSVSAATSAAIASAPPVTANTVQRPNTASTPPRAGPTMIPDCRAAETHP